MTYYCPSFISGRAPSLLLAVLLPAIVGMAVPARAFAEPLFESAAEVDVPRSGTAVRSRLVRLVADVRESRIGPAAAEKDPARIARAEALPVELSVRLFDDVGADFTRKRVQARTGGGYVWSGDAKDGRGSITLIVQGDRITGYAEVDFKAYRIEPVSGFLHRISEIDSAREKPDIVREAPAGPALKSQSEGEMPLAAQAEPSLIRVLVAYTPAAARQSSDIRAEIDLAVQLANEAYEASDVPIILELAGTVLVDYTEGGNFDTNLADLTSGASFRGVRRRRDKLSADLVALVRKESQSYCGNAWYVRHPSATTSEHGFSVVSRSCITNHSFAHELGHNMGLQHDRYVAQSKEGFNYGYVNVGAGIRDIMAYDNRCYYHEPSTSCTRVKMFSTPRLDYEGARIGRPADGSRAADNALLLNRTRQGVAAYR